MQPERPNCSQQSRAENDRGASRRFPSKAAKKRAFCSFAALLKHVSKSVTLSWINPPNVLPRSRAGTRIGGRRRSGQCDAQLRRSSSRASRNYSAVLEPSNRVEWNIASGKENQGIHHREDQSLRISYCA